MLTSGRRQSKPFIVFLLLTLLVTCFPLTLPYANAVDSVQLAYEFNTDGDSEGWAASGNGIGSVAVSGGALHISTDGFDPYWFGPSPLNLRADPGHVMVIRAKSNNGSGLGVFFDTDLSPGLSADKNMSIGIIPDGEYHEYRVKVGSHSLWSGVVQSFRLDLEPPTSFPADVSIDYVRFVQESTFGFEFNNSDNGWAADRDISVLTPGTNAITATITGEQPSMLSPALNTPAADMGSAKLRMKATAGESVALYFATDESSAPQFSEDRKLAVPIIADGQFHDYTIDLWPHPLWSGTVGELRLSLQGSALSGASWEIDYLRLPTGISTRFDWNVDGFTQGWEAAHSLTPLTAAGGKLSTTVTDNDPYMAANGLDGIIGERDGTMVIRLSATAGNSVMLFYGTSAQPGFSEDRKISFPIAADGQMHEYRVPLTELPLWTGRVQSLRLDLEGNALHANWSIDYLYFEESPAAVQFEMKRSQPSVGIGEEAVITAEVFNSGGKILPNANVAIELPEGLQLIDGDAQVSLGDLALRAREPVTWKVRGVTSGGYAVNVKMSAAGLTGSKSLPLPVLAEAPAVNPQRLTDAQASLEEATGNAVLENGLVRVVFPRDSFGYGQYLVYTWANGQWNLMASAQPFAYATVKQSNGAIESVGFYPDHAEIGSASDHASLTLSGTAADSSGRQWTHSFAFGLGDDGKGIEVDQQVSANTAADLLNMSGPVLTVGQGSFGSAKDEALFPGLEWLVDDESSSSELDSNPPHSNRLVPHPYKITMPLMAVRSGDNVVSLMWDPNQKWDGEHSLPAAKFASPNFVENQNNHVLGLSALSVPTFVKENKELATDPYPLEANRPLSLKAVIAAAEGDSVLEAVNLYLDSYGWPEEAAGHDFEKEIDLGLEAYLNTFWVASAKGWRHVDGPGWGPAKFPSNNVLLRQLGMYDAAKRPEAEARIQDVMSDIPKKSVLGAPDGHIPQWQSPFYLGYMNESLQGLKGTIQSLMNAQDSSGAWLFKNNPNSSGRPLGVDGEKQFGFTAQHSQTLLRYANMTGDEAAAEAGLNGIAAMQTMGDVPRAAQTWEVPVHTPDILAAGRAVGAYLEAYKWTKDDQYVEEAVKWARTGFPFIYAWEIPGLSFSPYATIPVFGSTAYVRPWFGVPVQWNGLVYSYALFELSRYDDSLPWRDIASGILSSAEEMQEADAGEPHLGGYPDFWELLTNERSDDVMINPEALLKNVFLEQALEGQGPEPDFTTTLTASCSSGKCKPARISSLAQVSNVGPSSTNNLVKFDLTYPEGETTYVLVTQRDKPRKVTINGVQQGEHTNLVGAASGWSYDTATGYLTLKVKHSIKDEVKIHY
ncbi:hypothetical protein [Paenibacillus spongiae]|uniref:Alpha-galactosidase NEW3 domain-containing protein n=1 Tax=Paenibacillus spongiae TaxID=2909671 RepID=A0ABY5S445_9BACL|nr:hypothetical protein [Paenibacillus spongiae]UVI27498.1 hypothetical protein L1F29_18695 [Paenibacillus spongiae]